MSEYYDPHVIMGLTYKVILVDRKSRTVTAQLPNGSTAVLTGLDGKLPGRGDIIFVSEAAFQQMSFVYSSLAFYMKQCQEISWN